MAKAKRSKKKSNKRSRSKTTSTGPAPIKNTMTKKQLINHIAAVIEGNDTPTKDTRRIVQGTLDALADTMARSIMPRGVGSFMLPRLLKIVLKDKKAIKKGTMVRSPASNELVESKGRPASKTVKIRPLAALKKAAAGES